MHLKNCSVCAPDGRPGVRASRVHTRGMHIAHWRVLTKAAKPRVQPSLWRGATAKDSRGPSASALVAALVGQRKRVRLSTDWRRRTSRR